MSSFFAKKWERIQAWLASVSEPYYQARSSQAFHPYLILCVDDDPDFCHYIQGLAQSVGLHVDVAYTFAQAKQKIEQNPPYHALIIDGHLPDGSGFELVAWIRKKKALNTPIGFLSRIYQDAGSFRILKESLKVDYVLEKPLQSEEINQLLVQLCRLMSQATTTNEVFPEEILSDLKESYQKSIFDKLERLEKLILTVQKHPTKAHLRNLKIEVHKIAGSAGSYGYFAVSRLCKDLETQLIKQIDLAAYEQVDSHWLLQLDNFFTRIKVHFQIEPRVEL